jgi:hypothetical protein
MQMSATECTDLSRESEAVRQMYGLDHPTTAHFGKNCLLARRLVERGVRFVQVYSGGNEGPKAWDAHDDLKRITTCTARRRMAPSRRFWMI